MTEKSDKEKTKYTLINHGNFFAIGENNKEITGYFDSYDKDDLQLIVALLNDLDRKSATTVTKKTEEQYIELLTDESVGVEKIAKLLVNKDKIITKQTHDLSKVLQKYEELDTKLYEKDFFEVENANDYTGDSRAFKNGLCVFNNRLGMAYSVTEIVEVLNNMTNAIHELEKKIKEVDKIDDFTLHCVNMRIKELMDFNHKMLNDAIDRKNTTEALIFENRVLVLVELGMKLSENFTYNTEVQKCQD